VKPLQELIYHEEPAWPLVAQWIAGATNEMSNLCKNGCCIPGIDFLFARDELMIQTEFNL
jgi:hypothetical protein